MPKISFVVPAYNVAPYLSKCLESLLAQTEDSIQILVVNDGSSDDTPYIAEHIARTDPRVSVIHQENAGVSSARNVGLAMATGEYVCFVDGDDWVESDMVERIFSYIKSKDFDIAIFGMKFDFHDGSDSLVKTYDQCPPFGIVEKGKLLSPLRVDHVFVNLLGYCANKFYRRELLASQNGKFDREFRLFEDLEFNSRVLPKADAVVLVPEAFYHYVHRPSPSLSKARDVSYLELRLRALQWIDAILEAWQVSPEVREEVRSFISQNDLTTALFSAASAQNPVHSLRLMLERPGVLKLVVWAQAAGKLSWRSRWVAGTLKNQRLWLALLPFRAHRLLKRLTSRSV